MDVLIADDRPNWMKKEDEVIACKTRCSFFKSCSSRFGSRCKKLGGSEIPKINNRKGRMNHARYYY